MPKITRVPAALLHMRGNNPAAVGDRLALSAAGHEALLVGTIPDSAGMVTVQETYQVKPEDVGLYVKPASVIMEMTEDEAKPVIEIYQQHMSEPPGFTQVPQGLPMGRPSPGQPGPQAGQPPPPLTSPPPPTGSPPSPADGPPPGLIPGLQ